jgi:hypothetical protein
VGRPRVPGPSADEESFMTSREERIRARAQEIWESEGRPEGRAEEHWTQAEREIAGEDEAAGGVPKRQTRGRKAESGEAPVARAKRTTAKETEGADTATTRKRTARSKSDAAKSTTTASDEGSDASSKGENPAGPASANGIDPTGKRSARAAKTMSVSPDDKTKRGRAAAKA